MELAQSLEKITDETKSKIATMKVVDPSLYYSVYSTIAKDLNIDIKDSQKVSLDELDHKVNEYLSLSNKTTTAVSQLDSSAQKAMKAIHEKDVELLQESLNETKALREEIEGLKNIVFTDELTKCYNRKWLNSNFLDKDEKFILDGVFVLIDINYFKEINDTLGHITGDKALIYITNHLKNLPNIDIIRYGGDEFILLFNNKESSEVVKKQLEQNREELISKKLKSKNNQFVLSFSYGIVEFKIGDSFSDILESSDIKMYEDKAKIKKRVKGALK